MSWLARTLIVLSAVLLLSLVVLRIAAPDVLVNRPAGFVVNMAWAITFFWGLTEWKGISVSLGSLGRPLTIASTCLGAALSDYVLRLHCITKSEWTPDERAGFALVTALVAFGWWKMLFERERRRT